MILLKISVRGSQILGLRVTFSLFFSSNRPGGQGGYDLYVVHRQSDDWLNWSKFKNLGEYINTAEDDMSISIDKRGVYAFMSSGKGKQQDIYEFHIPPNLSPAPTALVRGKVILQGGAFEQTNGSGSAANGGEFSLPKGGLGGGSGGGASGSQSLHAQFFRMSDGSMASLAGIDPVSGDFSGNLSLGEKYSVYVDGPGFAGIGNIVDLTDVNQPSNINLQLEVIKLEVGAKIRLNNIYFESDKAELLEESVIELERLVDILNRYPKMKIEIAGHTDSLLSDEYNIKLSNNRALAVYQFLLAKEISQSRLSSKGYGEHHPVASNRSKPGRQLNRRVEFEILSM